MVHRDSITPAARNFTTGLVVAVGGNAVAGYVAASAAAVGLFVFLVVAVPTTYLGMRFVAEGVALIVDDALDARGVGGDSRSGGR